VKGGIPSRAEPLGDDRFAVEADGRRVTISRPDRVLFPETGFTKGDLIDYYAAAGPWLLPHLEGRPLTLRRFPDGVDRPGFWEKRCPSHRPDWVAIAPLWSEVNEETIEYCVVEDVATLVWLGNLADVELHTLLARADRPEVPTALVFDLDPGAPAGLVECAGIALRLRDVLASVGLECRPKASGGDGMQVYAPLNGEAGFERTKPFAHAVARAFEAELPDQVVSRMTKRLRRGKVLIDWSQNDHHKTTVCVYSVRARSEPRVSVPLEWEEVEAIAADREGRPRGFGPEEALARLEERGDLFRPLLELRQDLPELDGVGGLA